MRGNRRLKMNENIAHAMQTLPRDENGYLSEGSKEMISNLINMGYPAKELSNNLTEVVQTLNKWYRARYASTIKLKIKREDSFIYCNGNNPNRKRLKKTTKEHIVHAYFILGHTISNISSYFDISPSTTNKILKKHRHNHTSLHC